MRKSRAQQDAETLAALEREQALIDSGEKTVDEAVVPGNEVDPEPQSEPSLVSGPEPEPEPEPEPAARAQDAGVEELRKQLAELRRQVSFQEQELNPTRKRAQQLEREVEELKEQLANRPSAPEGPADYGLTEEEREFETVTSISEKVAKATMAKVMKQVDDLKTKLAEYEGLNTQRKVEAEIAKHRSELTKALGGDNPDDLFAHPKMSTWADEQAAEEREALYNPAAYSVKFVAGVLLRFKQEMVKGNGKRLPSQGDIAVPSRVAPDVAERIGSTPQDIKFNPDTFQSDVNKLIRDGKVDEANRLVAAAERFTSSTPS